MSTCLPLAQIDPALAMVIGLAGTAIGFLIGFGVKILIERSRREVLEKEFNAARATAEAEAAKIVAEAQAQAKSELLERRQQFDAETEDTRKELREEERRLTKREDLLDSKLETINSKERQLAVAENANSEREKALAAKDREITQVLEQQ
ncbi:MAG: Rnase Y domain-containing protein, partial [Planctomycetota bacterium]